jgi:glutamate/tyrosine decarboxylase-like PLP-dependent enzyme
MKRDEWHCRLSSWQIKADLEQGDRPFLVVGSAGTVSTGAVDPLPALSEICRKYGLWFHVDGAYGAPAALVQGVPPDLNSLHLADSIAVDPHKWMYVPLEEYLNRLNSQLLARLEQSGEVFLSNAVVKGKFALRLCIVNFRTTPDDIRALPEIVIRHGRAADRELRATGNPPSDFVPRG